MEQQEIIFVDRGQLNFRELVPKIPHAFRFMLNKKNLAVAISEMVTMSKESKLQDLTLAYIVVNVFKDLNEERFISVMQPSDFFKDRINDIKRKHSGIEGFTVDCKEDMTIFNILIKQPDWDLEELIYEQYRELLKQYKDMPFDIRVQELF